MPPPRRRQNRKGLGEFTRHEACSAIFFIAPKRPLKSRFPALDAGQPTESEYVARMASSQLHESVEDLSTETREMHRALLSLIEELEAVDWYEQRADASHDEDLKRVLAHNRDEEKEHACMTLEWIRRRDPGFDACLRKFLFSSGPIVEVERKTTAGDLTLGVGSLREEEART